MHGIRLPFTNQGLTQYMNLDVQGLVMLQGKPVVLKDDGIYLLDSASGDNGAEIPAWFETVTTDFGEHGHKRMRSVFVRGMVKDIELRLKASGQETLRESGPISGDLEQDGFYINGERSHYGRYWSVRIGNVDGTDFSIDAVDAVVVIRPTKAGERGR